MASKNESSSSYYNGQGQYELVRFFDPGGKHYKQNQVSLIRA